MQNLYNKIVFTCGVMYKHNLASYVLILFIILPMTAFASDYGLDIMKQESTKLHALLFGPVLRIAGAIGAVYGIIRAFQTQSLQPIFIFGGISACTIIVPKVLEAIFKI